MKKILLLILSTLGIFFFANDPAYSKTETKKNSPQPDNWEYNSLVQTIDNVGQPYISGNQAIFTASGDAHFVGIAFDFENYRIVHPFSPRNIRDSENKTIKTFYFYIHRLPDSVQQINYRLVIDGLWTTDPQNPLKVYSNDTGLYLSMLDATREIPKTTMQLPEGTVRFTYAGTPGQRIRLGGTMTNWDSWIYELQEIEPGVYQLDLSLPPGTYYYNFFSGMNVIVDRKNPDRVYSPEGKEASKIVVK